jgi:dipeptidyl aminopeptidase/acylaminoacyl peptidase
MTYRRKDGEDFRKLGTARYDDDKASLDIIRMVRDSDDGYVLSNEKTGRFALYRYNFATQALGDLVFESPSNDIDDFDLSEDGKTVTSVEYRDDRERTVWFDATLKQRQEKLEGLFPGKNVRMISGSRDRTRVIAWVGGAEDPGTYYAYLAQTNEYQRIAQVNGAINPGNLAATRYTAYRARDGLDIPAYLTLPAGREPKGLPLVIMPHGGPYGVRDVLEFDPQVQFLANRGYAVLQPNYRGSDSYGKQYFEKGDGQWGRAMQDDLDDGMDWLVKDGIVDPKRVCIVGSSYGGYAALWGATRNPERYRCAASFAGITDVEQQLRYQVDLMSSRHRKEWQSKVKGDTHFDLGQISPLKQVDRLSVPVLVAHGDEDTRVPYRQSSVYAAALAKAGKAHEFHTYAGEGHGLASSKNLEDWLTRLEAFLGKYNPPD